ncbi:LysR family transcriptional regulator [Vibrio lamellibrachiae]|uniref:LysR family transcriptional regulator n=1 Tax=Vibrio lamellibrachiae TaxID=2910253 RepID=UPI003D133495
MAHNLYDKLDLNLLKVFFILYQEKNMRKAAERLFVTQPAVSKYLSKLRQTLDNDLFVKTSTGLTPTPYAEQVYHSLRPIILELENTINDQTEFNPEKIEGDIIFAISPFLMTALANTIYAEIQKDAPNASVHFRCWSQDTQIEIESGKIDMGISYDSDVTIKTLHAKKLGQDKLRIICREDHPIIHSEITPHEVAKYPVGTVLAPNWNLKKSVAEIIADDLGIKFNITLRSEIPSVLLEAVHTSNMIVAISKFSNYDFIKGIKLLEFDFGYDQESPNIYSYYHNKNNNSAQTLWLLDKLKSILSKGSV